MTEINCKDLSIQRINQKILNVYYNVKLYNYPFKNFIGLRVHDGIHVLEIAGLAIVSFEGLVLPKNLEVFYCENTGITSFQGLVLPDKLQEFYCRGNKITNFKGLVLPPGTGVFNCDNNKITSFEGLKLGLAPKGSNRASNFTCNWNKITSFKDLVLPVGLQVFHCDNTLPQGNPITSFKYLDLPIGLELFSCFWTGIKSFEDLILNCVIPEFGINHVKYTESNIDDGNYTRNQLIFIYLTLNHYMSNTMLTYILSML